MDIIQTAISEFQTGCGSATVDARPLGHSRRLYKGVHVRAALMNTASLYVGPSTVRASNGFELGAGDEVEIEIDDLGKVYVVAPNTAGDEVQTVTYTDPIPGEQYRLIFAEGATDWLLVGTVVADVQTAAEAVVGAGNVVVGGTSILDGPITLTFQGALAGKDVALVSGEGGVRASVLVQIDVNTTEGHLHLTFDGETTGEIAFDADAATFQAALETLSALAGNVEVSVGPGPATWTVTFTNDLTFLALPESFVSGDGSALVGGLTDVTIFPGGAAFEKTITAVESTAAGGGAAYSWIAQ